MAEPLLPGTRPDWSGLMTGPVEQRLTTMDTQAHSESDRLKALLAHREREIAVLRRRLDEAVSDAPASQATRVREGELREAIAENADLRRANSALLQSEAALTLSEGLFRTLADTLPQMVWSTRPDGYHDYYNRRWYEFTGVPVVVNTSFNLAGRPIVETPTDAVECFTSTEIDVLVLGPYVLSKRPLRCYLDTDSGA